MRWFLIDRFLELRKGEYARAIKNVSLGEAHLHDHFPGFPVMPSTLLIESCAQTAGVLAGHARDYADKVILVKVEEAKFYRLVVPGDQVLFEARILGLRPEGSRVQVEASVDGEAAASVRIMFLHLGEAGDLDLPRENFVFNKPFMSFLKVSEAFRNRSSDG